jgi:c-di-GMP-binding flagellar brake protein YcgR
MQKQLRQFQREQLNSQCLFESDGCVDQALIVNYSRMGALVLSQACRMNKKYVSIVYQNEKNQMIQMLCAIKHITEKSGKYLYGLQFIGIERYR